nr:hypothetical protein [Achromobacter ruhlandii]
MYNEEKNEFSFKIDPIKDEVYPRSKFDSLIGWLNKCSNHLLVLSIKVILIFSLVACMPWLMFQAVASLSSNASNIAVIQESQLNRENEMLVKRENQILDKMAFNHAYIEILQERHPEIAAEINKATDDTYPCLGKPNVLGDVCNLGDSILRSIGLAPEGSRDAPDKTWGESVKGKVSESFEVASDKTPDSSEESPIGEMLKMALLMLLAHISITGIMVLNALIGKGESS